MALTRKQRESLIEKIGFLNGISCAFAIDDRMIQIVEALDCVCSDLRMVLNDDDRTGVGINYGGEENA